MHVRIYAASNTHQAHPTTLASCSERQIYIKYLVSACTRDVCMRMYMQNEHVCRHMCVHMDARIYAASNTHQTHQTTLASCSERHIYIKYLVSVCTRDVCMRMYMQNEHVCMHMCVHTGNRHQVLIEISVKTVPMFAIMFMTVN